MRSRSILALVLAAALIAPRSSSAYAVFTHEALIDLVWNDSIRPLLLKRYPGLTDAALDEAHAYAYGGCVIQDIGYYPFGKHIFSDLTHYVRSGDFVAALLRNARDANELAFAIGALSHYFGDSIGHSAAVNPSTALTFPDLEKKYGPYITYENDPNAHIRTEFGFDVAQIAWRRYAPAAFREHIGFKVSRALLSRAFYETYGLSARSVLGPPRSAIASYRFSVRALLPLFARATVVNARGNLPVEIRDSAHRRFLLAVSQADYRKQWSNRYREPGIGAHLLAFLIRILPKIGKLQILAIKTPMPATEDLFLNSADRTIDVFRQALHRLADDPSDAPVFANRDLDTGDRVQPGAYALTDKTYAKLLAKITAEPHRPVPAGLRKNILSYYADPSAPITTKKNPKAWAKIVAELDILRADPPDPRVSAK